MTVLIADDACLLQYAGGDAYSGSPHTEHDSDQVLGKREFRTTTSVVSSEQPTRKTLAHIVVRVAGSRLRNLNLEDVHIAQQQVMQNWGASNHLLEFPNR